MTRRRLSLVRDSIGMLKAADEDATARVESYPDESGYSYFLQLSDDDVFAMNQGRAMVDDPPKGTTRKQLAQFLRSYMYAEWKLSRSQHHTYVRPLRWLREFLAS